jgi:predicted aminopeptidase
MRRGKWWFFALCLLLAGCESLSYYGQAVRGQLALMQSRESIADLLEDPTLDPTLHQRLDTFMQLRGFAADALHLPVGHNYEDLVRQQSPFVTWNVFAAPEFSLAPRQWCYPVAGCVSYRGYFKEEAARHYAADLGKDGWDVYVGGVSAYSTLGWFNDPLLSSVLERETWQLASVLFHELAHQQVYAPGDTEFNESFATAVEQEGLRRWLDSAGLSGEARSSVLLASVQEQQHRDGFVALVQGAVQDLNTLYASTSDVELLRRAKQARLEQLRRDYAALKLQWGGYAGYDNWFKQPLNNAQLATVATYNNLVPAFQALLAQQHGDLEAFYREVAALAALDRPTRHARLEALLATSAASS